VAKNDSKAVVTVLAIGLGLYLLSRPNCTHGCRTVAQHLLRDDVAGAFGLVGI
jgi:hypothetical protein